MASTSESAATKKDEGEVVVDVATVTETAAFTNPIHTLGLHPTCPAESTQRPLYATFLAHAAARPDNPFLGARPFVAAAAAAAAAADAAAAATGQQQQRAKDFAFESYGEVRARVRCLAEGMRTRLGLGAGAHVALLSPPRPEVMVLSLACAALHAVLVPVNENSAPDVLEHVLRHSDAAAVFFATVRPDSPHPAVLRSVLPAGRVVALDAGLHEGCDTLAAVEEAGSGAKSAPDGDPPGMDDLAVIMYTSGTTAMPKGVMLTHRNLLGGVAALESEITPEMHARLKHHEFVYYNFLPTSHIYGLALCYCFVLLGGCIGFFGGDRAELLQEIRTLKPFLVAGVPRVYQRFRDGILAAVAKKSFVARAVFNAAFSWKRSKVAKGDFTPSPIADKILGAVREQFGGRIEILLSGGALLPRDMAEFFRTVITPHFWDGYGATETTATGVRTQCYDTFDQIGMMAPFYNAEVKLCSVPDLGYRVTDKPYPRGEMLIRSPAVTIGYYKDARATEEALTPDGFYHTGDVVVLETPSRVRIIDRVRNMFKLSQGEYVSGEAIEAAISKSASVAGVFVHGDPTQPYPLAIIVPSVEFFQSWGPANGVKATDAASLCSDPKVREFIAAEIQRTSREAGLKGYEFVKQFHLHDRVFDEARDLVTSSLKLKRHVLRAYFKNEIAELSKLNK